MSSREMTTSDEPRSLTMSSREVTTTEEALDSGRGSPKQQQRSPVSTILVYSKNKCSFHVFINNHSLLNINNLYSTKLLTNVNE